MNSIVARRSSPPASFNRGALASQTTRRLSIDVNAERITTVIAEGVECTGNLALKNGIKIDGHMRGDLTFGTEDGLCIVARSATLEGTLRGPRALVMGTVQGDIHIDGLLMLSPTAMVIGNIYYDRIVVHDGAQISGAMHMRSPVQQVESDEASLPASSVVPFTPPAVAR